MSIENTDEQNINFIPNTLQNTWRNIVFGIVCGASISGAGLYWFAFHSYNSVTPDTTIPQVARFETVVPQPESVVEYTAYTIGGDISFDPPVQSAPRKVEMFVPFDLRTVSASGLLVKDVETGEVLFGENQYETHPIASITKLMSALVLEEVVTDWKKIGVIPLDQVSDSHVMAGETATLEKWFNVALIGSSNRAILALVDASGKSRAEFVARMNEKAIELGLINTSFTDPTGLDAGNISTPSEIALLLKEALTHERIITALQSPSVMYHSEETLKDRNISNTNWLLLRWIPHAFESVVGKTGYITESGYNFTGLFEHTNGNQVMVVILGSASNESRFTEAAELAKWAFSNYYWK